MYPLLRIARLLGPWARSGAPVPLDAEIRTDFRVQPQDLDTNLHMNNGRFSTLMDLGRLDWLSKTGLMPAVTRQKYLVVLGASQMVFLRSLQLWQRFELYTKLESWDAKWFIMTQRFERSGKVCAQGRVRGVFRRDRQTISTTEVLASCGHPNETSPQPSAATQAWLQALRTR